jgi:DNA-binding Xre family transcriptional regulator
MLDMVIVNRLKVLIAEKELSEGRKLTYRTISKETGISTGTLVRYTSQVVDKVDMSTLETLCEYFKIQPGELLVWDSSKPKSPKEPIIGVEQLSGMEDVKSLLDKDDNVFDLIQKGDDGKRKNVLWDDHDYENDPNG